MSKKKDKKNDSQFAVDDEYVMYIIINSDAGMGKGKIASQACHAACHVTRILERQRSNEHGYNKWVKDGETKIVLRATEKEMHAILEQYLVDTVVKRTSTDSWCVHIRDMGRTQIAPDTLTAIAFKPVAKNTIDPISKMKLL